MLKFELIPRDFFIHLRFIKIITHLGKGRMHKEG